MARNEVQDLDQLKRTVRHALRKTSQHTHPSRRHGAADTPTRAAGEIAQRHVVYPDVANRGFAPAANGRTAVVSIFDMAAARQQLMRGDLVAYQKPLYQVLALEAAPLAQQENRSGQTQSVADILRRVLTPKGGTL